MSTGKVVYKDLGLEALLKRVAEADLKQIKVGIVGPKASEPSSDGRLTNAEVAVINEYGSDDGVVPRRSFIRDTLEHEQRQKVAAHLTEMARSIVQGTKSADAAADEAGSALAVLIAHKILSAEGLRPNAPATEKFKGFNHPLLDTGGLVDAVSHQVVRKGGEVLESGSTVGDYQAFEVSAGEGGE